MDDCGVVENDMAIWHSLKGRRNKVLERIMESKKWPSHPYTQREKIISFYMKGIQGKHYHLGKVGFHLRQGDEEGEKFTS